MIYTYIVVQKVCHYDKYTYKSYINKNLDIIQEII